jgi:Helix-turn-helix domain
METITVGLPKMLDERQVARVLAVSVAALRRWRRQRVGPEFVHLGRCVRYDLRIIERFLAENSSSNKKAADSPSAAQTEVRDGHATLRRS